MFLIDDDAMSLCDGSRSVPGSGVADDSRGNKMCILGDGQPTAKGSIFCTMHKRTSDNIYNLMKTETGATGEEWDTFQEQDKQTHRSTST